MTEDLLAGALATPVAGIDNGFVGGYRVRFDEAGPDGRLRTAGLLRYAQDIAWRHSEALGFDRRWYDEQGLAWVVRAVDLRVTSAIEMGRVVRAETAVTEFRRAWARRRGEFRLPDGSSVAVVLTDWVIVDGRGRLVRIPDVFGAYFPSRPAESELTRVTPPPAPPDAHRLDIRVRQPDIDPMGHVNNGVYLDWLEEAVASAGDAIATTTIPRRVRLEYAASAEPGDVLEAISWPADGGWWQRLVRPADGTELARARLEGLTLGLAEAGSPCVDGSIKRWRAGAACAQYESTSPAGTCDRAPAPACTAEAPPVPTAELKAGRHRLRSPHQRLAVRELACRSNSCSSWRLPAVSPPACG